MTIHYAKLIDKCIGEQMDKLTDMFTENLITNIQNIGLYNRKIYFLIWHENED